MSFFHPLPLKVKLIGSNLVASFQRADPPLIWKFDLDRNHSFTIALQGDEGDWELGITSPKGEFFPIAHFPAREDAEDALMAVQKVLMKKRRSKWANFFRFVIIFFILIAAGIAAAIYFTQQHFPGFLTRGLTDLATAPLSYSDGAKPGVIPSGVPLSADEVLKPPQ